MPIHRYCYRVIVRLRRTRGSAVNGHGYGGCGSWLQRRQPSTMSAGFFLGFDTCRAPPPSRSLRGVFVRRSTAFERTRGKPATQPPRHGPTSGRKPENCLKVLQGVWRSISEQFLPWRVGLAFVSQSVPPDTPQDYKQGLPCNYRPTETRFRWSIVDGERLFITQKLFGKSVPYVGL